MDETRSSPRPRPTMREVAALAGVSLKTVSRVINGEGTVAAELSERVRSAAATLDYRPNLTARSLRSTGGRTRLIGVLLEDVSNPFSSAVHRVIEDLARERGMAVLAASLDEDPARERELAHALIARRVDGLIIVPAGQDHSYLATEQRAGISMVFIDRPPRMLAADAVVSANTRGAREGVEHLLAAGHRRIAFLGDTPTIATATERYAGYVQALVGAGIQPDDSLVRWNLRGSDTARDAVLGLIAAAAPTALFAGQNLITVGAIHALRQVGLEHRIALVGFDEIQLADLLQPGVTVVAQDPRGLAARACELLFARMEHDTSPVQTIVHPTQLIPRGSGEIPPS